MGASVSRDAVMDRGVAMPVAAPALPARKDSFEKTPGDAMLVTLGPMRGLTPAAVRRFGFAREEPEFLIRRRLRALAAYDSLPMPGRDDEAWRRVRLSGLHLGDPFAHPGSDGALDLSPTASHGVFWDDIRWAARAQPELLDSSFATEVYPCGETGGARRQGGKFHALNQALFDGGYVLHVPRGLKQRSAVRAAFRTPTGAVKLIPHNLVLLEEEAEATLIEEYGPSTQGLCLAQTEIILRPGASLRYILIQDSGPEAKYIGAHRVKLGRGARLTFASAHLGAAISKTFLEVDLSQPEADAQLYGLYFGGGRQQTHLDTWQHHRAPECRSDLRFKGVLDQNAYAAYRGMIRLEPGAQHTDAYQQNRTLLLSTDACVHSIPGLEINANDVRCTHGATAGQVDPEMLFYLRSRGLTQAQARKAIVEGFFQDILPPFRAPEVAKLLGDELGELLAARLEGGNGKPEGSP